MDAWEVKESTKRRAAMLESSREEVRAAEALLQIYDYFLTAEEQLARTGHDVLPHTEQDVGMRQLQTSLPKSYSSDEDVPLQKRFDDNGTKSCYRTVSKKVEKE
jgi:hypothetical protein